MSRYKEFNLTQITTYSASERVSKFKTTQLALPPYVGMTMREFLDGLPSVLKADDLIRKSATSFQSAAETVEKP
jgi:hypothetical protein